MKVFVGWDSREDIAYQVCKHSILSKQPNAEVIPLKQNELRDQLMAKMSEGKEEEKFDEMGCVKEMKKLYASGCTKAENYKKCKEGYGCSRGQFEKLYASNCG